MIQQTFLDADYYCESLIPPNSFYRRFRDTVGPLITDEIFAPLFGREHLW